MIDTPPTHRRPGQLSGKIAVVTGASSGLGLASALRFRNEGAQVYVTGRDPRRLADAVQRGGDHLTGVVADSAVLDDLDRLFARVRDEQGRIDVLYASAGVGRWQPLEQTTPADFDAVFDVNTRGTFFTVCKALPLLIDGASVILTGSSAAHLGLAGLSPYAASKAALRSFVRSWVRELSERRIRVNLLTPGSIDSAETLTYQKSFREHIAAASPAGRWGSPDEIASAALFLASDAASYVNGVELVVDGGSALSPVL